MQMVYKDYRGIIRWKIEEVGRLRSRAMAEIRNNDTGIVRIRATRLRELELRVGIDWI
jgi:hypothetical protein